MGGLVKLVVLMITCTLSISFLQYTKAASRISIYFVNGDHFLVSVLQYLTVLVLIAINHYSDNNKL